MGYSHNKLGTLKQCVAEKKLASALDIVILDGVNRGQTRSRSDPLTASVFKPRSENNATVEQSVTKVASRIRNTAANVSH